MSFGTCLILQPKPKSYKILVTGQPSWRNLVPPFTYAPGQSRGSDFRVLPSPEKHKPGHPLLLMEIYFYQNSKSNRLKSSVMYTAVKLRQGS